MHLRKKKPLSHDKTQQIIMELQLEIKQSFVHFSLANIADVVVVAMRFVQHYNTPGQDKKAIVMTAIITTVEELLPDGLIEDVAVAGIKLLLPSLIDNFKSVSTGKLKIKSGCCC